MNWKSISAVTLGAALFASAAAEAASCEKDADCSSGQVCSNGTCVKRASRAASDAASSVAPTESLIAGTKRTPYIGWGGIGFYNVSAGNSSGAFGLHAGGAVSLISLTPELPLIAWGDVALGFPTGGTIFPIKLGAGVRYDRAGPVQLLGGVAFAFMPNPFSGAPTPVGVGLMGTVLYPLPQLHPNLSAQAQIGYDFLSDGFGLFGLTAGAGWAF